MTVPQSDVNSIPAFVAAAVSTLMGVGFMALVWLRNFRAGRGKGR